MLDKHTRAPAKDVFTVYYLIGGGLLLGVLLIAVLVLGLRRAGRVVDNMPTSEMEDPAEAARSRRERDTA